MPRRADDYPPSPFDGFRRLDPQARLVLGALLVLAVVAVLFFYLRLQSRQGLTTAESPQMLLGNPSGATDNPLNRDKPFFVLSYSDSRGIPNWVSWRVTSADLGTAPRKQTFDPDSTLPIGFHAVTTHDYTSSGFDRGHMCPHSDRAANEQTSFATFVMTNVIPQAPNVNRKAWEQLENYGRELVQKDHVRLHIIAGPAGQGGRGSKGFSQVLKGSVVVPAECWKIIVVVPDDAGDDLAKISFDTRVIAVLMPNDQDKVAEEWAPFRTSVAAIEQRTGYHFFDRVRPDVASALRQKVDNEPIPPPRPHHYGQ
jgi:endonuclease G, mitochondrial